MTSSKNCPHPNNRRYKCVFFDLASFQARGRCSPPQKKSRSISYDTELHACDSVMKFGLLKGHEYGDQNMSGRWDLTLFVSKSNSLKGIMPWWRLGMGGGRLVGWLVGGRLVD